MQSEYANLGYFWAAILGMVQGAAEFLPISSSGHLALVEHLGMGVAAPASFDVFLHLATLSVVIYYFRRRILWYYKNDLRVLLYVVAATVPTGLIGVVFKKELQALRHSPILICIALLVTACALTLAEILDRSAAYQLRDLGWFGALVLGVCQALAIVPGISRSGMTIAGGMICGVDRDEAFNFSFILSIPAVLGAAFLESLSGIRELGPAEFFGALLSGPFFVGFVMAVVVGYFALVLLDRMVSGGRLIWFAIYCCLVAIAGLVYFNLFA